MVQSREEVGAELIALVPHFCVFTPLRPQECEKVCVCTLAAWGCNLSPVTGSKTACSFLPWDALCPSPSHKGGGGTHIQGRIGREPLLLLSPCPFSPFSFPSTVPLTGSVLRADEVFETRDKPRGLADRPVSLCPVFPSAFARVRVGLDLRKQVGRPGRAPKGRIPLLRTPHHLGVAHQSVPPFSPLTPKGLMQMLG